MLNQHIQFFNPLQWGFFFLGNNKCDKVILDKFCVNLSLLLYFMIPFSYGKGAERRKSE